MENEVWSILAVSVIATQACRTLPAYIFRNVRFSSKFEAYLEHLPIAVVGSVVIQECVGPSGALNFNGAFSIATVACVLFAWRTRSMLGTTAFGCAVVWLLRSVKPGLF